MKLPPRPLRDFEWELMRPHLFKGASILELGNKKNPIGVYKDYLTACGYRHVSIDINGLDGALPLDLRRPVIPALQAMGLPAQYDMLTNSGVIEHVVDNLEAAWRNAFDLVKAGGVQIHITPKAGHWLGHGLYHPYDEFFTEMAKLNRMRIVFMDTFRWTPGKVLTRVIMNKQFDGDFIYPGDHLFDDEPKRRAIARGKPL